MTVRDALNRGLNFFAVATLAILATTIVHRLSLPQWGHRGSEIAFGGMAAGAIVWYVTANHRYQRSLMPLMFVLLAALAKLIGIVATFGGLVAAGPDFGVMLLLLEVWVVGVWQFVAIGAMTRGHDVRGIV
jgi:hypothetical protein